MFSFIKNYLFPRDYNAELIQYSRDGDLESVKKYYQDDSSIDEICISLAYQYDHFHVVSFFLRNNMVYKYDGYLNLCLESDEEKFKKLFVYLWNEDDGTNDFLISAILNTLCKKTTNINNIEYVLEIIKKEGDIDHYINGSYILYHINPLKIACSSKNMELVKLLLKHGADPARNNLNINEVLFLVSPVLKDLYK